MEWDSLQASLRAVGCRLIGGTITHFGDDNDREKPLAEALKHGAERIPWMFCDPKTQCQFYRTFFAGKVGEPVAKHDHNAIIELIVNKRQLPRNELQHVIDETGEGNEKTVCEFLSGAIDDVDEATSAVLDVCIDLLSNRVAEALVTSRENHDVLSDLFFNSQHTFYRHCFLSESERNRHPPVFVVWPDEACGVVATVLKEPGWNHVERPAVGTRPIYDRAWIAPDGHTREKLLADFQSGIGASFFYYLFGPLRQLSRDGRHATGLPLVLFLPLVDCTMRCAIGYYVDAAQVSDRTIGKILTLLDDNGNVDRLARRNREALTKAQKPQFTFLEIADSGGFNNEKIHEAMDLIDAEGFHNLEACSLLWRSKRNLAIDMEFERKLRECARVHRYFEKNYVNFSNEDTAEVERALTAIDPSVVGMGVAKLKAILFRFIEHRVYLIDWLHYAATVAQSKVLVDGRPATVLSDFQLLAHDDYRFYTSDADLATVAQWFRFLNISSAEHMVTVEEDTLFYRYWFTSNETQSVVGVARYHKRSGKKGGGWESLVDCMCGLFDDINDNDKEHGSFRKHVKVCGGCLNRDELTKIKAPGVYMCYWKDKGEQAYKVALAGVRKFPLVTGHMR